MVTNRLEIVRVLSSLIDESITLNDALRVLAPEAQPGGTIHSRFRVVLTPDGVEYLLESLSKLHICINGFEPADYAIRVYGEHWNKGGEIFIALWELMAYFGPHLDGNKRISDFPAFAKLELL